MALPLALPPLMSGLLLLYVVGPYTTAGRLFGGRLTDTRARHRARADVRRGPVPDHRRPRGLRRRSTRRWRTWPPRSATGGSRASAAWPCPARCPGIGAGLLLAWLRAFGEFGATVILAYHPYSLPVFTFVQFDATGLPATMLPIAASLAAALVVLLLVQLPAPRRRRGRPPAGRAAGRRVLIHPRLSDFALRQAARDFSLDVAHRAHSPRLALLGPSGAGKTLTLRLLAGLTSADGEGSVRAGTRALDQLPAERREIGYVPQQPSLLPRRTVWRQVTFGARAQPALAAWWIERLGLGGLEDRYPAGALRRSAAPGRARPGARDRTAGVAPGRAVRRARPPVRDGCAASCAACSGLPA